jgi:protein O-GlcNAc transferase
MSHQSALLAALEWLNKGDAARAIAELEALVARAPDSAEAHNALGSALGSQGQTEQAVTAFRRALSVRPIYPEASTNLGSVLLEDGQVLAAIGAFDAAIASGRAPPQAHAGRGRASCLLGRFGDARSSFDRAVAHVRAPASIHSQRCYTSLLDPECDAASVVSVHRDYDARIAAPFRAHGTFENARTAERKLVLGYVSSDFREHSVASFLEGVLAAHDRSALELVAYSDGLREDETTRRLRNLFDRFQTIRGASHDELVSLIRRDQVDVLVDLAGHMQPNRLEAFARGPAPVLLTYLGYPGSTGMSVFNGRLTDAWADPTADSGLAGPEPQLHIAGGYFAYTPPPDAPAVAELPAGACGSVTFGSMNDILKVNAAVLATWAEILARTPGSRLFLKARALSSSDVRERVLRVLRAANLDDQRVELAPATVSRREHLSMYSRIDIALDTFPYSGATTTCEALYMGVPVVTLSGDRHAGRLSTSILKSIGLDGFVTQTTEEYVRLAVQQAGDLQSLSRLRRSLRDIMRASALADGARVARAIERTAADSFRRWSGSSPSGAR